jgi:hypothetical protein
MRNALRMAMSHSISHLRGNVLRLLYGEEAAGTMDDTVEIALAGILHVDEEKVRRVSEGVEQRDVAVPQPAQQLNLVANVQGFVDGAQAPLTDRFHRFVANRAPVPGTVDAAGSARADQSVNDAIAHLCSRTQAGGPRILHSGEIRSLALQG